jgi:tRNA-dihydrouridine synthase
MRQATTLPVTVKHRIGIDDKDRYDDMAHFVHTVAQAGCVRFIVHARKAVLQGLWKHALSARPRAPDAAVAALREAMRLVPAEVLDAPPQLAEPAMHSVHLCDTL